MGGTVRRVGAWRAEGERVKHSVVIAAAAEPKREGSGWGLDETLAGAAKPWTRGAETLREHGSYREEAETPRLP